MRLLKSTVLSGLTMLSACATTGSNPNDPYEPFNRRVYDFNMAVDATLLKPTAKVYKAILPPFVRSGVNNAFNNVAMIPTVANDVLQADWRYVIKDSWRFVINSTFGVAGLFDVANSNFGLPPHYNDMGLTFAKWGDKKSPYLVIPLLGPSTIRDGMGSLFDYTVLSPYAYIPEGGIIWGLAAVRYVDLRSQLFESEAIMAEALDKYAFMRDAYLQHRNYLITGEQQETGSLYIEDDEGPSDYVDDEPASPEPKKTQ
ncbi:MlaA family lipoprotein [Legionella jordanis]|uniref:Lipoprotein VacJ-like protein n=1 Tax=Legionella jordanis TaxID=456 RepID=A0A0W0V985_9GAMM|nr:VacJ family lipoprotein [Legionella jordanis]KTD16693.1 lipoprotein VacJ-like protein [Legionella jordanis]RMX03775.1 VacJ family lipoprotein [Legionella jordanis]RMX22164.1 VacJ family lipoprotein [Legionella jordanis]VEH11839.1 lipoprotein VacJ-like protein [Legionella jordanis]HAT8712852.1 VacJ family lipoprotein [Legionella jordanis]